MSEIAEAFPDLRDALLDAATFRQLCFDIQSVAEIIDVRVKGSTESYAGEASTRFDQAVADLKAGAIVGLQVRYSHAGEEWWDTLLQAPGAIRLVRVRAPDLG